VGGSTLQWGVVQSFDAQHYLFVLAAVPDIINAAL